MAVSYIREIESTPSYVVVVIIIVVVTLLLFLPVVQSIMAALYSMFLHVRVISLFR